MVGARSTKWLDTTSELGGQGTVETRHIQRARDEAGIFHVVVTDTGGTLDLNFQLRGRPDDTAPWFVIHKFLEGDLDVNGSGGAVVTLYPQMDMYINKMTGSGDLHAEGWLIE